MIWLGRRILAVWGVLVIACIGGIAVGRLDHTPNKLQDLGFGVCGGEACFDGIRLGTSWDTILPKFPKSYPTTNSLEHHVNIGKIRGIYLSNSDSDFLKFVTIVRADPYDPGLLATTAGAIVAQYGTPCRVYLRSTDGSRNIMLLIYPTLTVHVWVQVGDRNAPTDYRLEPDSPVWNVWVMRARDYGACTDPPQEDRGTWHGFTSRIVYSAHFLDEMNSRQR